MGSEFGLYCPPESRLQLSGPWQRCESISPLYAKLAPELDRIPAFIKNAVLDEFDAKAEGFEVERFEPAKAWLQSTAATLTGAHLNIGFDFPAIDERANDLAARSRRLRDHDFVKPLGRDAPVNLPLGNAESTPESIAL